MRRPTICFVSRKWPPAMGGMETYAHRLAAELDAHGSVTRMVLPGRPDGAPPRALALVRFGMVTALRLLAVRAPAEIVHVTDMASWPLALAARLRSRRTGLVLSAHGTDVGYPRQGGVRGRLYGAYLRLCARLLRGAAVIANSAATADAVAEYGFADVVVVPLAADVDVPQVSVVPTRVLFAGRLVPWKGCGWFAREVLPRLPGDMTLAVAGTINDPAEATHLQASRIEHLGRLDTTGLREALAGALCVVAPNIATPDGRFEGFGLVALEAAAAGGVVLAADHGGLRDAVRDGVTGFLLPPGDPEAWSEAILRIRDWSPTRRAAFLRGAAEAVRADYSWDRVARQMLDVYDVARTCAAGAAPPVAAAAASGRVRNSS